MNHGRCEGSGPSEREAHGLVATDINDERARPHLSSLALRHVQQWMLGVLEQTVHHDVGLDESVRQLGQAIAGAVSDDQSTAVTSQHLVVVHTLDAVGNKVTRRQTIHAG